MKHLKWLVPLAVVVLLLAIAIPAAADDPFGGPPSKTSGNGTSTWAAIYIGSDWSNKRDVSIFTQCGNTFSLARGNEATCEYDKYVTTWSAKITIPGGGSSRWFKFDTVKSRDLEVYVDDDPKWGAAYRYFDDGDCTRGRDATGRSGYGNCEGADNLIRLGIDTSALGKAWLATEDRNDFSIGDTIPGRNGAWARLYPPEYINRMSYFWPTPNNLLLTTRAGSGIRIGDTQGGFGGYNQGSRSVLNESGVGYRTLGPCDQLKQGDGNTHLLCSGKLHWDGWVYLRVFNTMIWDNDFRAGTRFTPNAAYDFPCSQCPYPFNPNVPPAQ